eukprot:scaffold9118_cov112-Isochrysis_galbana.AAC.3
MARCTLSSPPAVRSLINGAACSRAKLEARCTSSGAKTALASSHAVVTSLADGTDGAGDRGFSRFPGR